MVGADAVSFHIGEVLVDSGDEYIVKHVHEKVADVFIVDKQAKTVSHEQYRSSVGREEVNSDAVEPLSGHNDIITDYQGFGRRLGDCGGHVYSNHYEAGIAMEFGDSLGDFSNALIASAVCAAIGAVGGLVGIAIGAVGCAVISTIIVPDIIDTDGNLLSIGFWDCHGGWFNQASLCIGGSDEFVTTTANMERGERISGLHFDTFSPV